MSKSDLAPNLSGLQGAELGSCDQLDQLSGRSWDLEATER